MNKPFSLAAGLIFISALIMIYAGFTFAPMPLLPAAAGYFVIMAAITRGWRIVAWFAFFVTAITAIIAISQLWAIDAWWVKALAVTNGLAFLALLGSLWKSPTPKAA